MTVDHSINVSDIKGSIDDLSVYQLHLSYWHHWCHCVCIFVCANAMCSKTATRHFDVQSLTWPPKSPDLNPIDHMWDSLEIRIRNRPVQPLTS